MKYSKKKGGSPAQLLLQQQGMLSTINPIDSSKPLTYFQTNNVSRLIETSGGGRKRKIKKSRKTQSRRKRISKRKIRRSKK